MGAVGALAASVFTVTATEMMPIGLLSSIAADTHVSVGAAGLSVTLYGVVAGLLAPVLAAATRRIDRRSLVLTIVGVFVVGNGATALVADYGQLMAVRLGIGLLHGLMWSIVAGIAVRLVAPASAVRATAVVFSGISLALVLGVPAGTLIGNVLGWRGAFAALAVATGVAWLLLAALLPKLPSQNSFRLSSLHSLLRRRGLPVILAVTTLVVIGNYSAYTYIVPFLLDGVEVHPPSISVYLFGYGVAGLIGNFVAGAVVSRTTAVPALHVVLLVGIVVLTGALTLMLTPVSAALAMTLVAIWGLTYSALPVILQTFVFQLMPHAKDAATSLYVMIFNLSIAGGALLGGIVIDGSGVAAPIIVGALACGIGGFVTLLVRR